MSKAAVPMFVSIPHSGEEVPAEVSWLQSLPETVLMCDVDRFVDRLYEPAIQELSLRAVKTKWHRYVIDLNRLPKDVDADSVLGSENPSGTHSQGLHWVSTTLGFRLMAKPMERSLHERLVLQYFQPFHDEVSRCYAELRKQGFRRIYHLDLHSMPSVGTKSHRDPGERRADIVISDFHGKSCAESFSKLVIQSYEAVGFKVAYNWPYIGGRVTQVYGQPSYGQNAIQVELNRDLYMDEVSKQLKVSALPEIQKRLHQALRSVQTALVDWPDLP